MTARLALHERSAIVFWFWNIWFWTRKLRGCYRRGY